MFRFVGRGALSQPCADVIFESLSTFSVVPVNYWN